MAEIATLARPYANAVFDIAKSAGDLDRWSRSLGFLATASADEQIKILLDAPEVSEQRKAHQLIEVCGDELTEAAKKFVQVLAKNKRLPLIEAMASGTPVLTSNTTSLKEVAGDSGFTVDPLDVDAIRGGLFALLEDKTLAAAYRDKGLTRATKFSWTRCAEETLEVYRRVMKHTES